MLSNKLQKNNRTERVIKRWKRLSLCFTVVLCSQYFLSTTVNDISNTFFAQADGV